MWVSVDICAITIIALPSKNDLPVGHIMAENNNEIRPNLIFVSEVNDGADSGENNEHQNTTESESGNPRQQDVEADSSAKD